MAGGEKTGKGSGLDLKRLLQKVFCEIGARPVTLVISNVLLTKGSEIKGLLVIPENPIPFIHEDEARSSLKSGQSLFRVNITRIE